MFTINRQNSDLVAHSTLSVDPPSRNASNSQTTSPDQAKGEGSNSNTLHGKPESPMHIAPKQRSPASGISMAIRRRLKKGDGDPLGAMATASGNKSGNVADGTLKPSSVYRAGDANLAAAPESVITVSNQGVGTVDGCLYAWNAQQRTWDKTEIENIVRVKLGANNNEVWVMNASRHIARIGQDGRLLQSTVAALPASTSDFTVSPMGQVSYIVDGELHSRSGTYRSAEKLHPPAAMGPAKSLTQTNDGALFVLSSQNELWMMSARPPETGVVPNTGTADRPEYWQALTVNAPGARETLDRLQTLPDGGVGAVSAQGMRRFSRTASDWEPTSLSASSAMESFYSQFQTHPKGDWNSVGVSLLFPGQNTRAEEGFLSFSSLRSSIGSKSNWFRAHNVPKSTEGSAGDGDWRTLKQELSNDMGRLSQAAVAATPRLSTLPSRWADNIGMLLSGVTCTGQGRTPGSVDYNAHEALSVLEANFAKLPTHRDSRVRNSANRNALQAVLTFRTRVLNRPAVRPDGSVGDPISDRIATLLKAGVYLPMDEKKNPFLVPTGKLVHDHAVLQRAISELATGPIGHNAAAWQARIDGTSDNMVSTLFKGAIVDMKQFEQTNDACMRINTGMRDANHKLVRALTGQGTLGTNAAADKMIEFVGSMQPNTESITLKFGHGGGLDLEGLWVFLNLSDRNKTGIGPDTPSAIRLNTIPILTPLGTASYDEEIALDISRTDNGIRLSIAKSKDAGIGAGLRTQWGGGAFSGADPTFVAYAGLEVAATFGSSTASRHSVSLDFLQDDNGAVQEVLRDLFNGRASLANLLERADAVTNSNGSTFKGKGQVYAHAYAAGNITAGRNKGADGVSTAWRLLAVPGLEQLSLSGEYALTRAASASTDGGTSVAAQRGHDSDLTFNHITVLDVSQYHSRDLPTINDQASVEAMFKVPLFVSVLSKPLWAKQVSNGEADVRFSSDGALVGASINFATREAPIRMALGKDRPLTAENFPQLDSLVAMRPELQRHLDRINKNPRLRPSVTMELVPAAIATVRARMGHSHSKEELAAALMDAMQDPANLRITSISTAQALTYVTSSASGFGPVRFGSKSSNALNRSTAQINIAYDEVGAVVDLKIRTDTSARPDVEAFGNAADRGRDVVDGLLTTVTADRAKWILAASVEPGRRVDVEAIPNYVAAIFLPRTSEVPLIIPNGRLAMLNGELVYRPSRAGEGRIAKVPANIRHRIIETNPMAILSLMATRASGVLAATPLSPEMRTALNNEKTIQQQHERPRDAVPLNTALDVCDLIREFRVLGADATWVLNPAQEHILATFFPSKATDTTSYDSGLFTTLIDDQSLGDAFISNVRSARAHLAPEGS